MEEGVAGKMSRSLLMKYLIILVRYIYRIEHCNYLLTLVD
jgi:hypothetical protein